MSGPKRADVQAALNVAANTARRAASIIAERETAALRKDAQRADDLASGLAGDSEAIDAARGTLQSSRQDVAAVGKAVRAIDDASTQATAAATAADQARSAVANAQRLDDEARHEHQSAQAVYDRAKAALDRSGGHYLRDQMAWAREAQAGFAKAADIATRAQEERETARKAVSRALQSTENAARSSRSALAAAQSAQREADDRDRAEAEARRISEEARRRATVAVAAAQAAFDAVNEADALKFEPNGFARTRELVESAAQQLRAGDSATAQRIAQQAGDAAARLADAVARAREEYQRRESQAAAAANELDSAIGASDAELIRDWSNDPQALENALRGQAEAAAGAHREDFETAVRISAQAAQSIAAATASAAENVAADERRAAIGEAVMDVLEDLAFDVSWDDGNRDRPMKISGHSSDAVGKGDFDIEIPLDGEIDFEVTAEAGDGSCASTVHALQDELAKRGVVWQTTDWGHASGERPKSRVVKEVTKEVRRTITK